MIFKSSDWIIFRCDGSFEQGLGHLSRCAVLAESLAPSTSFFVIRPDPVAEVFLKKKSLACHTLPSVLSPEDEAEFLVYFAAEHDTRYVVLDKKDNCLDLVGALKKADLFVVDFEDRGPGRVLADILIDPHIWPATGDAAAGGSSFCGFGPDWTILHPIYAEFHELRKTGGHACREKARVSEVIVACGGSDPAGLTSQVLKTLDKQTESFRIMVAAGPGAHTSGPACQNHPVKVLRKTPLLARSLYRSDLAFVSGGITMSESLCLGVPTVVVPQHEEQFTNAGQFASKGALLLTPPPSDPDFRIALEVVTGEALKEKGLRGSISQAGWSLVDGKGVQRLKNVFNLSKIEAPCI
ncbi:MAG TPA: glycosyltransferase [archaeon]|nr:glycosyltransferase [archaeon]